VIYAVGDIHGRLDLLDDLLKRILEDVATLGGARRPVLVFVGDYVDRGVASRGVIDRLIALKAASMAGQGFEVRLLKGNHEETLLSFLQSPDAGPAWVEFGGGETLLSYGVNRPAGRGDPETWRATQIEFQKNFPTEHLAFMRDLELAVTYGDYLFVHAGVRPGVPLEQQDPQDLLWIRGDFLNRPHRLGHVVVHGHTPVEDAFVGAARINIDTGAYATGVLTAVRLHGEAPTVLATGGTGRI
jgi:serine/threonine protein phosphatase 1